WLYRITHNVVRHRRRRDPWRRIWRSIADLGERRPSEPISPRPTPVEELERREQHVALYRLLDPLPERLRTVLILYEREELSGDEIAELLGVRAVTVRVRLHRARERFLRMLAEERGPR